MAFYQIHSGFLTLSIKVSANAPKNEIKSADTNAEFLHVKIRAVREKGRANAELVEFLSETTGVAISKIEIVRGRTASLKVVKIVCADPSGVLRKIAG